MITNSIKEIIFHRNVLFRLDEIVGTQEKFGFLLHNFIQISWRRIIILITIMRRTCRTPSINTVFLDRTIVTFISIENRNGNNMYAYILTLHILKLLLDYWTP